MEWVIEDGFFLVGDGQWARQVDVEGAGRIAAVRGVPAPYPGAERISLRGGFAVPGLWDSHVHLDHLAEEHELWLVKPEASLSEVQASLRQFAAAHPDLPWIRGSGWNQNYWQEIPHRRQLDAVSGGRPVAFWARDHHTLWLNTAAMHALGVSDFRGSGADRDEDGPTGLFREETAEKVSRGIPSRPPDARAMRAAAAELASDGFVGVTAMERITSLEALSDWGEDYGLRLQVFWIDADGRQADPGSVRDDYPGWFRTLGVKLFSDGALGTRTAWMRHDYDDQPGQGIPRLHGDELRDRLRQLAGYRWAAAIHAIGDAAVGDVWRALLEVPSGGSALSRIEHAQLVDPHDLSTLSGTGLAASMQPFHLPGDVPALSRGLGDRPTLAFPWSALERAGFAVTFGSDAPIVPADPVPALEVAVRGAGYRGDAERGLSPYRALMAYSRGAARADRRPGGFVAPGHPADLTVFREDPLAALQEGRRPVVMGTVVGGRIRYWSDD